MTSTMPPRCLQSFILIAFAIMKRLYIVYTFSQLNSTQIALLKNFIFIAQNSAFIYGTLFQQKSFQQKHIF